MELLCFEVERAGRHRWSQRRSVSLAMMALLMVWNLKKHTCHITDNTLHCHKLVGFATSTFEVPLMPMIVTALLVSQFLVQNY